MRLFIFGAGYSGTAIARELRPVSAVIAGTGRSARTLDDARGAGITPFHFDGSGISPDLAAELRQTTHLISTIAPDAAGDPVLRSVAPSIAADMPALQWIGYLSTTGVYGDHAGGWVDEDTPCTPAEPRSVRRLAAEHAWLDVARARGTPIAILRLPGIYGPGRNALAAVADGSARRVTAHGHVFSRVHVDDIAGATALLARQRAAGTFNIADDEPAAAADVILFAAALMGVEPPPAIALDDPQVTPGLRSFYASSRRVANGRVRAMGYAVRHPNYRSGLSSMWHSGNWR